MKEHQDSLSASSENQTSPRKKRNGAFRLVRRHDCNRIQKGTTKTPWSTWVTDRNCKIQIQQPYHGIADTTTDKQWNNDAAHSHNLMRQYTPSNSRDNGGVASNSKTWNSQNSGMTMEQNFDVILGVAGLVSPKEHSIADPGPGQLAEDAHIQWQQGQSFMQAQETQFIEVQSPYKESILDEANRLASGDPGGSHIDRGLPAPSYASSPYADQTFNDFIIYSDIPGDDIDLELLDAPVIAAEASHDFRSKGILEIQETEEERLERETTEALQRQLNFLAWLDTPEGITFKKDNFRKQVGIQVDDFKVTEGERTLKTDSKLGKYRAENSSPLRFNVWTACERN